MESRGLWRDKGSADSSADVVPRSRNKLPQATGVETISDLDRKASARAHRPSPQRVPIGMANGHVYVRPAADPRCDVVDIEVLFRVDAGLEGERPDDSRRVELLRCADVPLREVEHFIQGALPQGRGVVANHDEAGDSLLLIQGELLVGRQSNVTVEGRLKAPVNPEQFEFLARRADGRVEEIEVEHGPENVPFDPRRVEVRP